MPIKPPASNEPLPPFDEEAAWGDTPLDQRGETVNPEPITEDADDV